MFNVNKISELYGIVGLNSPANPAFDILDSDNKISRSGRFVTDNAFCKLEYIIDNFPFINATADDINLYLKKAQINAIKSVVDNVFNTPDFIDRQLIYQNAYNKFDIETLPLGFIGFKIEPCRDKYYAFEIVRCILEFDVSAGAQDITLLLYNNSSKLPIKITTINVVSDLQEVYLNWRLDNTDMTYKGKYFFGYITEGLDIKPYKRNYESSNIVSNIDGLEIDEVLVSNHIDETEIFNLLDVENTNINSGLNPEISVFDDYTQLVLSNQMLFASAIEKKLIINLLSDIIASPRFNNNQRASKDMLTRITIELEGIDQEDGIKKAGLKRELMGDINHIRKEINRLRKNHIVGGFVLNQR